MGLMERFLLVAAAFVAGLLIRAVL